MRLKLDGVYNFRGSACAVEGDEHRLELAAFKDLAESGLLRCKSFGAIEAYFTDEYVRLGRVADVFGCNEVDRGFDAWVGPVSPDNRVVATSGGEVSFGRAAGHREDESALESRDLCRGNIWRDVGVTVQTRKPMDLGHV